MRECLAAAAGEMLDEVRVCGGGAASDYWCQTIADVLAIPVLRSRETENGARGAHLFALAALGETGSVDEGIARYTEAPQIFTPDPKLSEGYRKRFALFQQLRDTARLGWQQLAGSR